MSDALRLTAVDGTFYPNQCKELKKYFEKFNQEFNQHKIDPKIRSITPRAILVPHAGYIYSGFTANFAYRFLENATAKRIVVIGPSHYHTFKGVSAGFYEAFQTPCGNITIDTPYLFALAKKFNIAFHEKAHLKEHSTEVQMPFIKHYFPKIPIIELVYGEIACQELVNIIVALLQNKDNLVVISSDLSHFYPLKKANEHDNICLSSLSTLDNSLLHKGCEACGLNGIEAMIKASKELKLSSKLLDYKTSANTLADEKSVVGYVSVMFYL